MRIRQSGGVFLLLCLCSCSSPFALNTKGYRQKCGDLDSSWATVSAQSYKTDSVERWESPREFFATGGGDCKGFAVALVYLLGPEASVVVIAKDGGRIHAVVKYKGYCLEPQKQGVYLEIDSLRILYTLDYYLVMAWVTNLGTRDFTSL